MKFARISSQFYETLSEFEQMLKKAGKKDKKSSTLQIVIAVNNFFFLVSGGSHIRLKNFSRLLDLCPGPKSYLLKEQFMLIGSPARSHVIFA